MAERLQHYYNDAHGELHIMLKRILIAEDEQDARELLASIAIAKGYDVITVTDGLDLLAIAAVEKFDVIITDLMMPNMTGASAAEIMKLQGNATPIIALTALTPHDMDLVQSSFAKIYHKPCNISELFDFVESLAENKLD